MKKFRVLLIAFSVGFLSLPVLAQTCTSNPTTITATPINFSAITWTGTGGMTSASCTAIADGSNTTTTADFVIKLASGVALTIDKSITINGNFVITNNGTSSVSIPNTVLVTGNMGDPSNNNCDYIINGSLTVEGTFSGKNSNQFSGTGSISGGTPSTGTFSFSTNTTTCGATCPTCSPQPSAFCTSYQTATPIKLSSFSASSSSEKIQLYWSTVSELNFDYFSLQRSSDGKVFNEITQVKGHGTTNETHNYSYDDNDPFVGRSYYRLTSNDFDGYQETFHTVSVEYIGGKKFSVSPNPSDGVSIKLNFNFHVEESGIVTIYDNVGSIVGTYPVADGSISFASNLKNGIYLAKFSSSSFTKTDRFLVK